MHVKCVQSIALVGYVVGGNVVNYRAYTYTFRPSAHALPVWNESLSVELCSHRRHLRPVRADVRTRFQPGARMLSWSTSCHWHNTVVFVSDRTSELAVTAYRARSLGGVAICIFRNFAFYFPPKDNRTAGFVPSLKKKRVVCNPLWATYDVCTCAYNNYFPRNYPETSLDRVRSRSLSESSLSLGHDGVS